MPRPTYLLPLLLLAAAPAHAVPPPPAPVTLPPPITAPQDKPFPGEIALAVDATDTARHIFRVHETIPVAPGAPLTLLFPKWLPGNHGPTGPLPQFAGLVVKAGGKTLPWLRDTVDMGAFHLDVPGGTKSVDVEFEFLSPVDGKDGRVVATGTMVEVEWRPQVLFPAGYYSRDIQVHATVDLPAGWQYATALDTASATGGHVTFKPVNLETLLDSPVLSGRYFSRIDLDPGAKVPVHLDITADDPEDLEIKPADLAAHRNLVQQAYRNYGSHHYDHYDFLLSLSDEMGGIGLEHQRSSEDGVGRDYFTDLEKSVAERDLLPHEYTHSWNGKFRRPADLWSPDDHVVPEQDSLLWVYEGQTEYWGQVLAARAGLQTQAQARDLLAIEAADLDAGTPGRTWRNLQDTTNDPIISWHRPSAWRGWSRFGDYYQESALIWLDADTLIRQKTNGAKSLTDFARAFLGVDDGAWGTETYTFDDVVRTLNGVYPYDWAGFLRARLDGHGPGAPLDGLTRGGWRLVYTAEKSPFEKAAGGRRGAEFTYALGLSVGAEGVIEEVRWGGPAFNAGLARSTKLIAVNGLALDGPGTLADAIKAAATAKGPITLLIRDGDHYRDVKIDYHGGLRYPHLERIPGTPDLLGDVLTAIK